MISYDNKPLKALSSDVEFTVEVYRQLLKTALANYLLVTYRSIPWGERFLLWRNDCDYSLNRSLALGRIEEKEGLCSTFYVSPHSEFYNLFERSQLDLLTSLLELGHDIGLHFDGDFYTTSSGTELHEQVHREANLLAQFVGVRPTAFSFHNPSAFHLTCEADTCGGLINCYSRRFKI